MLTRNNLQTNLIQYFQLNQNLFFLDAKDINSVYNLLKNSKPRIVINCIGYANVDLCERDSAYAKKINTIFPAELASSVLVFA